MPRAGTLSFRRRLLYRAAILAALLAHAPLASASDKLSDLKRELARLSERVDAVEVEGAKRRRATLAAAVEAGEKPRSWKLPGTATSMQIGGYVKLDAIWDLGPSLAGGSLDTAAVFNAPREGSAADNSFNGGNWRLHARQTRFWIRTWTPTDWGELATHVEGDFFGAANTIRLRHAYGSLGPVLAGQTDTTWRQLFAEPELIDFAGPVGAPSVVLQRQALIRYHHNFGAGTVLEAALDDPTGDIIAGGTAAAQRLPDIVVALSHNFPGGRFRLAAMLRQIEHDTGAGSADSALAWGVNGGVVYTVIPALTLGASFYVGEGVGKYNNLLDAVVVSTSRIDTVFQYAGTVWAQWRIAETVRLTGSYSYILQDAEEVAPGASKGARKTFLAGAGLSAAAGHYRWSAHGNVLWNPVPAVTFGIEYVYVFESRYAGPNAYVSRIQGTAIYRF
jgi:hypothetical protein